VILKMKYEPVIGLEIHSELKTATKIFCGCATTFGAEQNTHTCPVCLGLPGVLPSVNKKVVEFAIKAGLATNCKINKYSKFDRKNYYYPDLPKNWQTSQYDLPIAYEGFVDIEVDGEKKTVTLVPVESSDDGPKSGVFSYSSDGETLSYEGEEEGGTLKMTFDKQ